MKKKLQLPICDKSVVITCLWNQFFLQLPISEKYYLILKLLGCEKYSIILNYFCNAFLKYFQLTSRRFLFLPKFLLVEKIVSYNRFL